MRITALLAALVLLLPALAAAGQPRRGSGGPEPLLHVGPRAATSAVVTGDAPAPVLDADESDMTRRLRGVLLELSAQDLARLRTAIPGNAPRTASTEGSTLLFTLTVAVPTGETKVVRLLRAPDGTILGAEDGADGSPGSGKASIPLDTPKLLELTRDWPLHRGNLTSAAPEDPEPGVLHELPRPYDPSPYTLDAAAIAQRLFGRRAAVVPATRRLDAETFFIRLPTGYTPRRPAGLLVFVDPSPGGRGHLPPPLFKGADELGFILVGAANIGNDRDVVERMQLALDAAATVAARYHVDPERTYVSGLSGGGKVASMLWAGFPEAFRAAISMVGVSTYQNIPTGGGRAWRAGFNRPTGDRWTRLRSQRLATVTGSGDGNQAHILASTSLMRADGLAVQAFDYPDLAHEYPSPERFREALAWIDEPARERRAKEQAAAAELLAQFKKEDAGAHLKGAPRRRALVEITRVGPWTDAAWEAAALLGLTPDALR